MHTKTPIKESRPPVRAKSSWLMFRIKPDANAIPVHEAADAVLRKHQALGTLMRFLRRVPGGGLLQAIHFEGRTVTELGRSGVASAYYYVVKAQQAAVFVDTLLPDITGDEVLDACIEHGLPDDDAVDLAELWVDHSCRDPERLVRIAAKLRTLPEIARGTRQIAAVSHRVWGVQRHRYRWCVPSLADQAVDAAAVPPPPAEQGMKDAPKPAVDEAGQVACAPRAARLAAACLTTAQLLPPAGGRVVLDTDEGFVVTITRAA